MDVPQISLTILRWLLERQTDSAEYRESTICVQDCEKLRDGEKALRHTFCREIGQGVPDGLLLSTTVYNMFERREKFIPVINLINHIFLNERNKRDIDLGYKLSPMMTEIFAFFLGWHWHGIQCIATHLDMRQILRERYLHDGGRLLRVSL